MTKTEREWLNAITQLGCVVCRNEGCGASPAAVHHIQDSSTGVSQRAGHLESIPLCALHHQHGAFGVAVHNGTREWESRYGTQRQLLAQTQMEVAQLRRNSVL